MKINYTTRGPTAWKDAQVGQKVIIYEGWNTNVHTKYAGKVGVITDLRDEFSSLDKPIWKVEYGNEYTWVYPMKYDSRKVKFKFVN